MRPSSRLLLGTLFAGVVGVSSLAGCALERDPIDRTQPNFYDKGYFTGEWHYQRTIVDTPAGQTPFIVGETGWRDTYRITWDIQEDFLFGRRNYEIIEGGDLQELEGEEYEGEVVAAYRILRHFDRTYAYNPSTGERLNIIEENSMDRPWYERQYIRVDWSANLVTNTELQFESASAEPVPYFVQEFDDATGERHPDAPLFESEYFDVTNKLYARAGTVWYPPYGEIPLCWFFDSMECGAGEYTIRNSFKRIDPNHQYEKFPYKGKMTEVYGYFWADRDQYDPDGLFIQNRERFLSRHNLWEKSFDDAGEPLPYAERTLKPIVYHVNRDFPSDDTVLKQASLDSAQEWNVLFEEAVTVLGYPLAEDEDVYILCINNPVKEGDPAECGPAGTSPRLGDLRRSFLAYIPRYGAWTPLGFGPPNVDPTSGEIINANSYIYERNEYGINRMVEMIEVLNGTRNADSYIAGVDLTEWLDAVGGNSADYAAKQFTLEDAAHFVQQKVAGPSSAIWEGRRYQITAEDEQRQIEEGVDQWAQPFFQQMYDDGIHRSDGDHGHAKLSRLAGTEIEDMMVNNELLAAAGVLPGEAATEQQVNELSVLRGGGFSGFLKDRVNFVERYRMENNMYVAEFSDLAMAGLAKRVADEGLTHEELVDLVRYQAYVNVITHEIGHNLGLMHNFGGSDDAFNYHDEYWALRTADGTVAPRTVDPITDAEVDGDIYKWANTTTMDYSARFGVSNVGTGKYDRAAILFGYARKVEVLEDTGGMTREDVHEWHYSDGDPVWFFSDAPKVFHYTDYYEELGEKMWDPANRVLVDLDTIADDFSGEQGRDGRARVPYIYCSHTRVNLGDSCLTWDYGADSMERMQHTIDEMNFWYIQRNFPRGRIGVDNWNYVARTYRYYDRLKSWHDVYGLYLDFLPQFYSPQVLEDFFMDDLNGWGTKTWAVQNAFNHLMQTVLMPDVNDYEPQRLADGRQLLRPSNFGGAPISTDVVNARYFSTSWFNDFRECGYFFWECMHHIGYYLDKIMAIEALSDSETNFVGRSTPEDIREWEISYYSTFGPQISRINAAILGQNWGAVAPYYEGGTLRWPNYTGDMLDTHAQPMDPFATFSIQLYWQALGRARFPNNYDRSFEEESRVFILGTGFEPTVPADRLTEYHDPISGLTYCAVRYDSDGGGEQLIERANMIRARSNFCDDAAETAILEDDCVQPESGLTRARADAALHDWNEVLKTMVLMDVRMNWGDPYNP